MTHLQRVQTMTPDDYFPCLNFARWYLKQIVSNQIFLVDVLFHDEVTLTRSCTFNNHKSQLWDLNNPHSTITHVYQEKFSINAWARILNNNLVEQYILPSRVTAIQTASSYKKSYMNFWSTFLQLLAYECGSSMIKSQLTSVEASWITWMLSTAGIA